VVAPSGYAWHYLDVVSDDGRWALVVIALVGNPFSSRYARAREGGPAAPTDFVAMNVALHGPHGPPAFCLTERGAAALDRGPSVLRIGPSSWTVSGRLLTVRIEERTAPFGGRVTGDVRVDLGAPPSEDGVICLDTSRRHRWWPIAPSARAEIRLDAPGMPEARFDGAAYVDAQAGDEPVEAAFRRWTWSRVRRAAGPVVSFDVERRDGSTLALTLGARTPPLAPLPASNWRLPRTCRSEGAPRLVRGLEDGPCYARALVETIVDGELALGVHEVLDCDRLRAGWVRFLMPFRTRRSA
jgi:carotenoid 1,2-hydratase